MSDIIVVTVPTTTTVTVPVTELVVTAETRTGATGATGAAGVGVPAGGTAGQVLSKIDGTDYNTQWSAGGGGSGTVTSVSVTTANGVSGSVATATTTPAISLTLGAITPSSVASSGAVTGTNLSGTNTGDNAVNTLYSGLVSNATHTGDATGATALTVVKINGTSLAGLATGILKNTTGTGVPSIAVNSDLPVMSATVGGAVPTPPNNTTTFLRGDGTFAAPAGGGDMVLASVQTNSGLKTFLDGTLGLRNVANTFTSLFTNTATAARTYTLKDSNGTIAFTSDITGTNSGTNTGDQTITLTGGVTGSGTGSFAATVVTNANLTGDVTSSGNATTVVKLNGTTLSGLATGLLKNTNGTGVPSIAINSDLPVMSATVGGAVPTPPNNTTTFLRGDGTFATPAGGGQSAIQFQEEGSNIGSSGAVTVVNFTGPEVTASVASTTLTIDSFRSISFNVATQAGLMTAIF